MVFVRGDIMRRIMEVNQKLTAQYKCKKHRRPSDGRVVVISHVLESKIPGNGTYFEAIYDVIEPEPRSPGRGPCALDVLQTWKRIVSIRDVNAMSEHDFPFEIGEEVKIDKDGNTGIVEDAIWEATQAITL